MITAKISAGSSTIVQDIIDMCQALHSPLGDWQGFFYKSTTGDQSWCVWAQRMDEEAHELQYVSSSGKAAPPDGYELITVSCPTVTGFALSFTQVNMMPTVTQTTNSGSSQSVNANGVPNISIRMSAAPSTNVTDMSAVVSAFAATGSGIWRLFFYNSAAGSKPWQAWAVAHNFFETVSGGSFPISIIKIYMSGMASPPAGSENLAITCPSAALVSAGYVKVGGPMSIA